MDNAQRLRDMYNRKKSIRECIRCPEPASYPHTHCEKCRDYKRRFNKEYMKRKKQEFIDKGLCPKCGGQREDKGRRYCINCRCGIHKPRKITVTGRV